MFVTLILNIAQLQTFTVCVSFQIFQSKSEGFASTLSICIEGFILVVFALIVVKQELLVTFELTVHLAV